ncbi:MAG: two-component sensor histidine kinase [Kiritimatiellae bacterium]|nr:two-component sensor histidine kinase [Kiritimatiellia bacterium]
MMWRGRKASKKRMNLRVALLLYVLVPMGLVTAMGAWWSLRAFERQVEMRLKQDLEIVARAIELPLNHALLRDRQGAMAEALRSAFDLSQVYGAYLYDADGKRISDSTPDQPESAENVEELDQRVTEGERHGEYGRVDGQHVYSYLVPMTDAGGHFSGWLQLTRPRSDFQEQIIRVRFIAFALYLTAFLGLTGIVLLGYHRGFGQHLDGLSKSMSLIASGERAHRHLPEGPLELAELGQHFNRMLDDIDRAESELARGRQQQHALEEKLRHAEKLAAIGELAAGVAHELGTPLSLIDAKSQRALRVGEAAESDQKGWADVRRETQRMESIIRQLLDFSRRHQVSKRPVSAGDVVEAAVASLENFAHENQTTLDFDGKKDCQLKADPVRLEQALSNLLRNAIQAAPGGKVRADWREAGEEVIFSVEDDGTGVDPSIRDKLFEPFFTTKNVGEGTGLGLSVVHGIVGEHGGRVEIEDLPGKGTRFQLFLPKDPVTPKEES